MQLAYNPALDERPRRGNPNFGKPHKPGCKCGRCDMSPIQCPVFEGGVRCTAAPKGRRALGAHIHWTHMKRKRRMAAVLVPDGLGYLKKALTDPNRIYGIDFSALPRFCASLLQSGILMQRNRKMTRYKRAAMRYMLERAQANIDGFIKVNAMTMPAKIIEPIVMLARAADVPVPMAFSAVCAYGLEKLANDLRAYRTVPDPHIPTTPRLPEG